MPADLLFDAIDQGVCVIEVLFDDAGKAIDYRFLRVNPAFVAQTDLDGVIGKTVRSLIPQHEEHWFEIYGQIALTGEPRRFEQAAAALGRWYEVQAYRVGRPEQRQVLVIFNDIVERRRSEERLQLLATEMGHRAMNLLTVIGSMVRLTTSDSVEAFKSSVAGRIDALARSQRMLARGHEIGADLGALIEDAVAAYQSEGVDRVRWQGPDLTVAPAAAQGLAMALHELATNATKHGALSADAGRVTVTWSLGENGQLVLRWAEAGGPTVAVPSRKGLGMGVIRSSVQDPVHKGHANFHWQAGGLVCELVLPRAVKPEA